METAEGHQGAPQERKKILTLNCEFLKIFFFLQFQNLVLISNTINVDDVLPRSTCTMLLYKGIKETQTISF